MRQAIHRDAQPHFTTRGDWVKEPDALDKVAVTARALVSGDDGIKGALFGTATGKTKNNHARNP